MCLKKIFNWCIKEYKILLAIGALLAIIYYTLEVIKNVGFTINLPKYIGYFHGLEPNIKIYILAGANFIFTIVFVLLITTKNKKNSE